ncbi:Eco57I restriction-modification methylase domain-containing protein [Porphyromonadaceae bacterium W3.11]|nr:Eco57I restriction-modification methylase domain-containing protein [Porphyromonadaceae bacterium W3.11]
MKTTEYALKEQFEKVFIDDFKSIEVIENKIIKPIFEDDYHSFSKNPERIYTGENKNNKGSTIHSIYHIGTINRVGLDPVEVFDITVNDKSNLSHSRANIQKIIRSELFYYSHAFMIFHHQSPIGREWRFSYLYKQETLKSITDAKRYTYLFGKEQHCRTAIDRFYTLASSKKDNQALIDAFSVEALTKQFYNDLFEWYLWAIDPKVNITFPNNTNIPEDDREKIDLQIIRLITRIMFVWFIKQKDLVPDLLFDPEKLRVILKNFQPLDSSSGIYYNAILQNLFFATLNRAIEDENGEKRHFAKAKNSRDAKTLYRYAELFNISEDEVINIFAEVPFLNGGLFECLDKSRTIDGVDVAYNFDGFSRNEQKFPDGRYKHRAFIPNHLFFTPDKGLFSILSRYNFTIEESTPIEQQVALDPELLGKVFENLLGAYNPETKETARNQSGSFYTPREIVHYMVNTSLIEYLGRTPIVESLFSDTFERDNDKEEEYNAIAQKLKNVKIIDPACGSGAFPMGLLNQMVDILQKIHPDKSLYQLKLKIIENCIYGVDIQSIAAQITKLRFFISLICDCEKDPNTKNFGIPILPNLETKFVVADSLIGKKENQNSQPSFFDNPEIQETKDKLIEIRQQHFLAKSASEKRELRTIDEQLRAKLAQLLSENEGLPAEDAEQLVHWNPYDQNAVSPFFDPEWMFGINNGFDIVIGNPPYVQLQNNKGELAERYKKYNYKTYARTGDIYCLFYERGYQLLKNRGHLCFITSNKWMRAGYGEKTRGFLAENSNPKLLIDFAGVKIFESATVDTNILLFEKSPNKKQTTCAVTTKEDKNSINDLSVFVQQAKVTCAFSSSDSWVILSPIEQSIKRKIEAVGTPLKDWDINIYRGVLTGCNEAFIISTDKRNEILSNCESEEERTLTEEIIRPILRGRDIKRFGYEWANLWLIWIPWHFPLHLDENITGASKKAERALEKQYQSLYRHLLKFKDALSNRNKAETGIRYEWYALQRWGAKYWEDFSKPKVMWKIIGNNINFCYDEESMICNNAVNIMTGERNTLIQFVGLMNSQLFDWYLKITTEAEVQGGGIQLYVTTLEKTLLKLDFQQSLTDIVYKRIMGEASDISVDDAVFEAYGLTKEETIFIGNYNKMNRD